MRLIIVFFYMVLLMNIDLFAQQLSHQELSSRQLEAQNRQIVKLVVEELSKDLPKRVDQYTQFVDIGAENNTTLLYTFEINTGAKSDESIKKEDHARMKEAVTLGVCHSSKRFLDAKISIAYLYRSAKSKETLFRFDITPQICKNLGGH